jgi:hypothetical protein
MSWQITIRGDGPMPTVTTTATPDPPLGQPPVVSLPPPAPPEDTSPFAWPLQPSQAPYQEDERTIILGAGFYAALPQYRNPLPAVLAFAGFFAQGVVSHDPVRGVGLALDGMRLWAPMIATPAQIRHVLATGRP